MEKRLTVTEAVEAFPHNPEAGALALGMVLMQHGQEEINRISGIIEEHDKKRIEELEAELAYWRPLGKKWLRLKHLLADDPEPLA